MEVLREDRSRRKALEHELERVLEVLIRRYDPEKVLLFGSLAAGAVHPNSDLDLVIVKYTDLRFLDRIAQVLQLVQPRVGIDVFVYTPEEFGRLSEDRTFFREEVLARGKVLYERDG